MKYIRLGLNWAFGIIFLLVGLYLFSEFPVGGLALILASSLLIPIVRKLVYSRTSRELSLKARGFAILLLLAVLWISVAESQYRYGRELAAMDATTRVQSEVARSDRRHGRFFMVDAWDHADYVEQSGPDLCAICHSLETSAERRLGPGCLSCHRDVQAFKVAVENSQLGQGRKLVVEIQESFQTRLDRSQDRHTEFFGIYTWSHSEYAEDNGADLCVICHSLEADGPSMSGRGPRCISCHRDIDVFANSLQHNWQSMPTTQ